MSFTAFVIIIIINKKINVAFSPKTAKTDDAISTKLCGEGHSYYFLVKFS